MVEILVIAGIAAAIVIFIWSLYNGLVTARVRVREAWSGIDVQLKRRSNLIPNLVETVKGYVKHEREVLENVTKARTAMLKAEDAKSAAAAENMLTGALKSLFAVAEAYPQLKANENFKHLQEELSDTETKIAAARQFYNSVVAEYNTKIKVFPNVLLVSSLGFKQADFFEAPAGERAKVSVKF